jgi:hypothetical protein
VGRVGKRRVAKMKTSKNLRRRGKEKSQRLTATAVIPRLVIAKVKLTAITRKHLRTRTLQWQLQLESKPRSSSQLA